jgi:hypothetical protein
MVPYCGEETTRNVLAAYKPKPKDVLREGPSAAVDGLFARAHTLQLVCSHSPILIICASRAAHAVSRHTHTRPTLQFNNKSPTAMANSDDTPRIWWQFAAILHLNSKTGVVRAKIRKIGLLARRVMCR